MVQMDARLTASIGRHVPPSGLVSILATNLRGYQYPDLSIKTIDLSSDDNG